MAKQGGQGDGSDDAALLALFGAIASRDRLEISRRLDSSPGLASRAIHVAASRQDADTYFLAAIRHYVYGADPRLMNKRGSTPLHLAVQSTGRSDSGSEAAKDEQRRVIGVLLQHGASATDVDANGKSVAAAASSDWIRDLLDTV